MARKVFIATIQVAVTGVSNEAEAADAISGAMELGDGSIEDWQYLRFGGQFLYPSEKYVRDGVLEEGEAFA